MHVRITEDLYSYGPEVSKNLKKGDIVHCMRHELENDPLTTQQNNWYLLESKGPRNVYVSRPSEHVKIIYSHPDLPDDYGKENLAWVSGRELKVIDFLNNRQASFVLSDDF